MKTNKKGEGKSVLNENNKQKGQAVLRLFFGKALPDY